MTYNFNIQLHTIYSTNDPQSHNQIISQFLDLEQLKASVVK
jgi:hypothetical protein